MIRRSIRPLAVMGVLLALIISAIPAHSDSTTTNNGDKFRKALEGKQRHDGFFVIHRGGGKAFLELSGGQLNRPFLMMSSVARGVATGGFVNGMTLGTYVLSFDRTEHGNIRLVRKNVRFKKPDGPLGKAFDISFSDSPILTIAPVAESGGRYLIDMSEIFMRDLEGVGNSLRGLGFDRAGSSFGDIKTFPRNVEIRSNLLFTSGGRPVSGGPLGQADARGVEIVLHYSLAPLPDAGYKPRVADDRVGYFTTVLYDFARPRDSGFIRLINRWRLEKADPKAEKSPAVKPIIFWIENTVPYEYRPYVRQGIEAWNSAFEQAGIINAIEVRQMPEDADWDPEDARYNTIRWTAAFGMGFAIGPSRVNPMTGEILDADILIDANFVRYFERDFRLMNEHGEDEKMPIEDRQKILRDSLTTSERPTLDQLLYRPDEPLMAPHHNHETGETIYPCLCQHARHHWKSVAVAGLAHTLLMDAPDGDIAAVDPRGLPPTLIGDALRELVMHEVGHTLGLRHNFKGSTLLSIEELKDKATVDARGFTASVMDYTPIFVSADPARQAYFYAPTIGPYDKWAIRYGYTPLGTNEDEGLAKIASEASRAEHIYGTDEDAYGAFGIDPYCRVWDFGREPIAHAKENYDLVRRLWQRDWSKLTTRTNGDRFVIRQAINTLLYKHYSATYNALDFIGGIRHFRHRATDPDAMNPVVPVDPAIMREALEMIMKESLGPDSFGIPAELLQQAAPTRWRHWGHNASSTINIHATREILFERQMVIYYLHSKWLLDSMAEIALMDENALTPAEIMSAVTDAVWAGITDGKPIPADRRAMQAEHLTLIAELWANPPSDYPREGRMLARTMLRRVADKLEAANVGNDTASTIHVEGMLDIAKNALSAQPQSRLR